MEIKFLEGSNLVPLKDQTLCLNRAAPAPLSCWQYVPVHTISKKLLPAVVLPALPLSICPFWLICHLVSCCLNHMTFLMKHVLSFIKMLIFSAHSFSWVLTCWVFATMNFKYLLGDKIIFWSVVIVNMCIVLYAFVSGHWDEAQEVSQGTLCSQENTVVTISTERTIWCKYAANCKQTDIKSKRKPKLMTSFLSDRWRNEEKWQ